MNNELEIFKKAVLNAKNAILRSSNNVVNQRDNVQTKADLIAQEAIISTLREGAISCQISSEELEESVFLGDGKYKIDLDPVDGSYWLLRGMKEFTSVAMIVIEEDKVKYSFCQSIISDDLYYCDSSNAYLNDKKITCDPHNVDEPYFIAGYAEKKYLFDQVSPLEKLPFDVYFLNYAGSLLASRIGENKIDAVIEFKPTSFHEFAGAFIAEKAGAVIQTISGDPIVIDPSVEQTIIVARSEKLLKELQKVLNNS